MSGPGSKPGERRGGRQKGTPNKKTAELLDKVRASGKTPMEFFCDLMNDDTQDMDLRIRAGEFITPYIHARKPTPLPEGAEGGQAGGIQIIINGTDAAL